MCWSKVVIIIATAFVVALLIYMSKSCLHEDFGRSTSSVSSVGALSQGTYYVSNLSIDTVCPTYDTKAKCDSRNLICKWENNKCKQR